jgi:hypothetical protein
MGEISNDYKILVKNLRGRDLGIDLKQGVRVWAGYGSG